MQCHSSIYKNIQASHFSLEPYLQKMDIETKIKLMLIQNVLKLPMPNKNIIMTVAYCFFFLSCCHVTWCLGNKFSPVG